MWAEPRVHYLERLVYEPRFGQTFGEFDDVFPLVWSSQSSTGPGISLAVVVGVV